MQINNPKPKAKPKPESAPRGAPAARPRERETDGVRERESGRRGYEEAQAMPS